MAKKCHLNRRAKSNRPTTEDHHALPTPPPTKRLALSGIPQRTAPVHSRDELLEQRLRLVGQAAEGGGPRERDECVDRARRRGGRRLRCRSVHTLREMREVRRCLPLERDAVAGVQRVEATVSPHAVKQLLRPRHMHAHLELWTVDQISQRARDGGGCGINARRVVSE